MYDNRQYPIGFIEHVCGIMPCCNCPFFQKIKNSSLDSQCIILANRKRPQTLKKGCLVMHYIKNSIKEKKYKDLPIEVQNQLNNLPRNFRKEVAKNTQELERLKRLDIDE